MGTTDNNVVELRVRRQLIATVSVAHALVAVQEATRGAAVRLQQLDAKTVRDPDLHQVSLLRSQATAIERDLTRALRRVRWLGRHMAKADHRRRTWRGR